jgi:hypothetical protein
MHRLGLFMSATLLGGVGGLAGSVLGAALGNQTLFIGGFLGGILIAPLTARLALWRQWITPDRYWPTAIGAALGFVAAATIAVNTLSSPVGPVLSTALTGVGALLGSRFTRQPATTRVA